MEQAIPEEIVRAVAFSSFEYVMIFFSVVIAIFIIVIFARVIPNRVQLYLAGVSIKLFKKYKFGDVIKIDKIDWSIAHLNTYRITFERVLKWDKVARKTETAQDEDLSIDYITFLKMAIHRLGNCRS